MPAALRLGLISTKRGYQPYPAQCSRVPLLAAVTRSPPAFSATAIAPPLLALCLFIFALLFFVDLCDRRRLRSRHRDREAWMGGKGRGKGGRDLSGFHTQGPQRDKFDPTWKPGRGGIVKPENRPRFSSVNT